MRFSSSRAYMALTLAQVPGCGDMPDTPDYGAFLYPFHAALHAGMSNGWFIL